MSRPRPLALLSAALVAATAILGATIVNASAGPAPAPGPSPTFTGTPFPSPTASPFPSPSPTFTPSPSPTPTFSPSPTPTITPPPPVPCQAPSASVPADPFGASAVQDETQDVGSRIQALEDQNGYPGFTSMIADPDHAQLLLCWLRGDPLPAPIASIVASPGQPIRVVREDTPFSYADLSSRVTSIDGLGPQTGGTIHGITVPEEGTGLVAGVQPDDPGTFDPAQAAATLSAAAGVPVTVQVGPPPAPFTRLNDTSPWFGGGRLTDALANPTCSSGFGMVVGMAQFLLTARHCGVQAFFNGQVAGAGRQRIGNVTAAVLTADSEAISIAAPGVAGRSIYTGGVNDATEGSIRIARVGVNIRNQFVCTSGSFSGEHCLLQIRNVALFLPGAVLGVPVRLVGPLNLAVSAVGGVAAGGGDSGGPVAQRSSLAGPVSGMGTINGGFAQFPCAVYDARRCSTNVIYNHLGPLLRAYGGALP